jgi:thiamine biosynthesis lipoprotein
VSRWFPFRRPHEQHLYGVTMGTRYSVKYVAAGRKPSADTVQRLIEERLNEVNRRMSLYLPDSELSQLNRHGSDAPFAVSSDLFRVLQRAAQVAEESGGAFDVTVGPSVEVYGFGRGVFRVDAPSGDELISLRERVGYWNIELDPVSRTVRKARPDVACDLSGIAKGYAVDCLAEVLDGSATHNYMIEIGGEVRAKGCNAAGEPWRIAIERPVAESRALQRVIELADRSVATSGDYRVFYVRDGRRISHTIDPRTCRPIEHGLASVTVIHQECMSADAWATSLMVLGPQEGHAFAEQKGLSALFLLRQDDNRLVQKSTGEFAVVLDSESRQGAR